MILFASDLDGTLMGPDLKIPEASVKAIRAALAAGHGCMAATGRPPATAHSILSPLHTPFPAAVMNGAGLYNFKERRFEASFPLPRPVCGTVWKLLSGFSMSGFFYAADGQKLRVFHPALTNLHQRQFMEARSPNPFKTFVQAPLPEDAAVLLICIIDTRERTAALEKALREALGDAATYHRYADAYLPERWYLELSEGSVSKASGVLAVKERFRFEKVIACGDNLNDLSMFAAADEAYAVANAHPDLKAAADGVLEAHPAAVGRFIAARIGLSSAAEK